MKYIDITLPTPEHNLACDEALLDWCEEGFEGEILRFWESRDYFIVLGYSGKTQSEIYLSTCQASKIPILRRTSGGGTVLQGPGCLNYSLILEIQKSPALTHINKTNDFIMERHKEALMPIVGDGIEIHGFNDLAHKALKFSGNAQRRKKLFLLYHGSFLINFNISLMNKLLRIPRRQPVYRRNRLHSDFLANLNVSASKIKQALQQAWHANEPLGKIPSEKIAQLIKERYGSSEWNFKF